MYLSAERLAITNQAVTETFEQTCIAWQAIPHWLTGDPGQTKVPADDVNALVPAVIPLVSASEDFDVTLAVAIAATPDTLLNKVIANTVDLAAKVDKAVVVALRSKSGADMTLDSSSVPKTLDSLIDARAGVEKEGFRAPSCLITDTAGLKILSKMVNGYSILNSLLDGANVDSLHRAEALEDPVPGSNPAQAIMMGRRQRIPHGGAADASAGEEPVDLAVSVPPSLEVIGENGTNKIALSVRIRYALRVKDSGGLITLKA